MLRKARKDAAGGLHHIIVRGIERRKIFREDEDPVNFKRVVERVAKVFGVERKDVVRPDKQPQTVKARSLLCFWLNRELGMTTVDMAKRLRISLSAVSRSLLAGQNIAENNKFKLMPSHLRPEKLTLDARAEARGSLL